MEATPFNNPARDSANETNPSPRLDMPRPR